MGFGRKYQYWLGLSAQHSEHCPSKRYFGTARHYKLRSWSVSQWQYRWFSTRLLGPIIIAQKWDSSLLIIIHSQNLKELESKSSSGSMAKKGLLNQYLLQLQHHPMRFENQGLNKTTRIFVFCYLGSFEVLILLNFSFDPCLGAEKWRGSRRNMKVWISSIFFSFLGLELYDTNIQLNQEKCQI